MGENWGWATALAMLLVSGCGDSASSDDGSTASGGAAGGSGGSGGAAGGSGSAGSGASGGSAGAATGSCAQQPDSPYCQKTPGPSFTDESSLVSQVIFDAGGGGGGLAWLDYDNDGDLDLYVSNGVPNPAFPMLSPQAALWRNDGDGTFTNVVEGSGLEAPFRGGAALAGDIDNDGNVDLFVTGGGAVGSPDGMQPDSKLYRNDGDGTFTDISATAGIPGPESAWSSAFGDIDNDGDLDLYVSALGALVAKRNDKSHFYINNGDLTFTETSTIAGVDTDFGACAVTMSHYDDDGLIDLFVANCNEVNFVPTPVEIYRNNGDGTFTDVRMAAGVTDLGYWMGIAHADIENDGDLDFFATNFGTIGHGLDGTSSIPAAGQGLADDTWHGLWRNEGDGTYTNIADDAGLARFEFAWGCSFADFDNDGLDDLFYAGAFFDPDPAILRVGRDKGNPGRLFMNNGDGTFGEIEPALPIDLSGTQTWAITTVDYDADGFEDIIASSISTPETTLGGLLILKNGGGTNRSVVIDLEGTTSNRDAIGARVRVTTGSLVGTKSLAAGSSWAASEGPWLNFGIGSATEADEVEVLWPSGLTETWSNVASGSVQKLVEGTGTAKP